MPSAQIGYIVVPSKGLAFNGNWTVTPDPLVITAQAGAGLQLDQLTGVGTLTTFRREIPPGAKVYIQGSVALIPNLEAKQPLDTGTAPAVISPDEQGIELKQGVTILHGREFYIAGPGREDVSTAIIDGVLRATVVGARADLCLTRLTHVGSTVSEVHQLEAGDIVYVFGSYVTVVRK